MEPEYPLLTLDTSTASKSFDKVKYTNQQNGRQAWRSLHDYFFGGDKVNTMVADVLSTLKALHYGGD